MPYTINKYNGAQITVVADGTIDSTLDIKLIGKNYAGYGEVQNENFVFMLENFANPNPPPKPISGQIWFDSANNKLKFNDGNRWRTTGGAEIAGVAPTGLTTGDFWFDTVNKQVYAWDGASYVLVGPQGVANSGATQMRSRNLRDTSGNPHAVIEAQANGVSIFVISPDGEFEIDRSTHALPDLTGFTKIRQGVTLTNNITDGYTDPNNTSLRFWGTASNADRLGGFPSSDYALKSDAAFSTVVKFADVGYTVGIPVAKLRVFNQNDTTPTIQNIINDSIVFQTTVNSNTRTAFSIKGLDILPGLNYNSATPSNIGSSTLQFNTIYANSFSGTATQADTLNVSGTYRTASLGANANTIAVRDASANIVANIFQGTATQAYYADLAEMYLADNEYDVGTVLMVGGDKEVTASRWGKRPLGAVSANPAYLMNKDLEGGTIIALKGRIPVKVIGSIKKGDELIAADNGCAMMAVPHAGGVFAIALESNDDTGIKLVECVIL